MKNTTVYVGLFISFLIGFYLHDFVTTDTEEMIFGSSHSEVQPLPVIKFEQDRPVLEINATQNGTILYEGTKCPANVPFEQGMTLMPGQSATVTINTDVEIISDGEEKKKQT